MDRRLSTDLVDDLIDRLDCTVTLRRVTAHRLTSASAIVTTQ
jgi:hypothetical protein